VPIATRSPDVVVFAAEPGDARRKGRTLRALRARGLDPIDASESTSADLAARLGAGPVWLVGAGAFLVHEGPITFPLPSATGRPLCALGAIRPDFAAGEGDPDRAWSELLARTGGDLTAHHGALPPLASVYFGTRAAADLAARLLAGEATIIAAATIIASGDLRLVRYAALDVHEDPRLRVVLAVTSLQQGGAERVVLDLAATLPAFDVVPILATLGRPTRAAFQAPPGTIDLSRERDRLAALVEEAIACGADLVHAHLLKGDQIAALSATGIPVALTIHNTRPGWPAGLDRLESKDAALLLPCSLAAEADLASATIPVPCRTIWNGIDAAPFAPSAALHAEGAAFRAAHGLGEGDLVLLAVANPRPQKRLHLLPAVLAAVDAALAARGIARRAHLVIAGDADPRGELAAEAARELREAITAHGLAARVHLVGSQDRIAPALAAADALVSTSAHEGLSLAHLEALAAGIPVIATDAGGTAELAVRNPAMRVLPRDAAPDALAEAIVDLAIARPEGGRALVLAGFTRERMASRYAALYRRAIAPGPRAGGGIVLIANNFSTGGAQSSARRLLTGLAAEGVRVRAVVLQEQERFPTPGRSALVSRGIQVFAAPTADTADVATAVAWILDRLDEDPPEAVLFWNALAQHKVLLADALLHVPVFDVSPGEMYFASLEQRFARNTPGLPYRDARAYGARLAGLIVKYEAEAAQAASVLGAPVHVVPNGIDLGPAPAARSPGKTLVIGTAARLSPQKKLEDLLAALRIAAPSLPPHTLRIAGGPERGSEAYSLQLKQSSEGLAVEWLGELEGSSALLDDVDLFAMISEPAGCPNASLEAMARGLAVIATDVGGASEQVVDGLTGRLVPRGDAAAFAAALIELGNDAAKRAAMGAAGRARAEARFDARRMVADYRRICLGR
jgi:glycosyltransferase involved in cell wall biosynthesis